MTVTALTFYVLIWPVLVGIVLLVLVRGFLREWRQARREGRSIV